jgi:hypothetical protein
VIRHALGTTATFLGGDTQGLWVVVQAATFDKRLSDFLDRHHLQREGVPLALNCTILRRTFTTRSLYEGRSIHALRLQLGHVYLDSTRRYGKFDRFEHPSHVHNALDEYGRKALTLWQKPLLLKDLPPAERLSILGAKADHQQDVGLCRYQACVKAEQGSPPPCSLCEHLVTGPEFLPAWREEYQQREQELHLLAEEPESMMLLAQMKGQFERFTANYALVQERS